MTTVVDASVLVAALVDPREDGRWAESTLAKGSLVAPELALVEATDVLRQMEYRQQISRVEATFAHTRLAPVGFGIVSLCPPLPSVYGSCVATLAATTRGTLPWRRR